MGTKQAQAPGLLRIIKHADQSEGERVRGWDPQTERVVLVNPETGNVEPWTLAGVDVIDAPDLVHLPHDWVAIGAAEGWLTLENERLARRPGGPAHAKLDKLHEFVHADAIVIHTTRLVDVDDRQEFQAGPDVRYRVVLQPDKYVADAAPDETVTEERYAAGNTAVNYHYVCERED